MSPAERFRRVNFYNTVRNAYGPLKQSQVDGFSLILNEALKRGTVLDRLAYMLATTWWETAQTMQPVREANWVKNAEAWRKKHLRYWPYYGRGYVQLTWEANYRKASAVLSKLFGKKIDLVANPDLALRPEYAVVILFVGMEQGWFTSKSLADYLDGIDESDVEDLREFTNARRIINGTDHAAQIGKDALVFEKALRAGAY